MKRSRPSFLKPWRTASQSFPLIADAFAIRLETGVTFSRAMQISLWRLCCCSMFTAGILLCLRCISTPPGLVTMWIGARAMFRLLGYSTRRRRRLDHCRCANRRRTDTILRDHQARGLERRRSRRGCRSPAHGALGRDGARSRRWRAPEMRPQISRDLDSGIAHAWARQRWRAERRKHFSIARMISGAPSEKTSKGSPSLRAHILEEGANGLDVLLRTLNQRQQDLRSSAPMPLGGEACRPRV